MESHASPFRTVKCFSIFKVYWFSDTSKDVTIVRPSPVKSQLQHWPILTLNCFKTYVLQTLKCNQLLYHNFFPSLPSWSFYQEMYLLLMLLVKDNPFLDLPFALILYCMLITLTDCTHHVGHKSISDNIVNL